MPACAAGLNDQIPLVRPQPAHGRQAREGIVNGMPPLMPGGCTAVLGKKRPDRRKDVVARPEIPRVSWGRLGRDGCDLCRMPGVGRRIAEGVKHRPQRLLYQFHG